MCKYLPKSILSLESARIGKWKNEMKRSKKAPSNKWKKKTSAQLLLPLNVDDRLHAYTEKLRKNRAHIRSNRCYWFSVSMFLYRHLWAHTRLSMCVYFIFCQKVYIAVVFVFVRGCRKTHNSILLSFDYLSVPTYLPTCLCEKRKIQQKKIHKTRFIESRPNSFIVCSRCRSVIYLCERARASRSWRFFVVVVDNAIVAVCV